MTDKEHEIFAVQKRVENLLSRYTTVDIYDSTDEERTRILNALRSIVGKESIRCDKCQCIVCPPIKCMSCISDAPQESRDINRNLTEQNELLTQRIAELEKEVEAAELRGEKRGFEAARARLSNDECDRRNTVRGWVKYETYADYKKSLKG